MEPDQPPLFAFESRRSVVYSTRGIVASSHPLACQAGLQILQAGGNAADAAVAVSAVLGVVDPAMTGIGGDVFGLFYDAGSRSVKALNASGRSPLAATREAVCRDLGIAVGPDGHIDDAEAAAVSIPETSVHSITVPGAAAGWIDAVEHFGSGKVTLAQVLEPAIRLADGGFPLSRLSAHWWAAAAERLRTTSADGAGRQLLRADAVAPGGFRAPREGEIFRCPELAHTMRLLADHGRAGFYEGAVAEAMVAAVAAKGGCLRLEDLKHHAELPPDIGPALSMEYGDDDDDTDRDREHLRLWEHPPNGQGIVALLALGILRQLERTGKIPRLATMGHNSPAYIHAVVSALRIAFGDASWYVADPAAAKETLGDPRRLLRPDYIAERAARFDPDEALKPVSEGRPGGGGGDAAADDAEHPGGGGDAAADDAEHPGGGGDAAADDAEHPPYRTSDTVYLAVTDEAGNGCSFVSSVSDLCGSGLVPRGLGFALQNRGRMFRLGPADHPNVYAGGKRAYNTIIPGIVTADSHDGIDRLAAVLGVMGGFMQPQGHLQVLLNMRVFGFDPQTALDAPRFCIGAGHVLRTQRSTDINPNATVTTDDRHVFLEDGVPASVPPALQRLQYTTSYVRGYARYLFGRGQIIRVQYDSTTGERVYAGASDGRGDGHAVPL